MGMGIPKDTAQQGWRACELGTDSSAVLQGDSREILVPLSSTELKPKP